MLATGILAGGGLPTPASGADDGCPGAGTSVAAASAGQLRSATLCLLNEVRAEHRLGPLGSDSRLEEAAEGHAAGILRSGDFSHGAFAARMSRAGYPARRAYVGENMAWATGRMATPRSIVRLWMHSPEHRANILTRRYRAIGIGIERGMPGRRTRHAAIYVTDFGSAPARD